MWKILRKFKKTLRVSRAGHRKRISVVLLTIVEKVYSFFGTETVQNVEKTEKIQKDSEGSLGLALGNVFL